MQQRKVITVFGLLCALPLTYFPSLLFMNAVYEELKGMYFVFDFCENKPKMVVKLSISIPKAPGALTMQNMEATFSHDLSIVCP